MSKKEIVNMVTEEIQAIRTQSVSYQEMRVAQGYPYYGGIITNCDFYLSQQGETENLVDDYLNAQPTQNMF